MEYTESRWNGFKRIDFEFEERQAILVCPDKPQKHNKWLYKTEYFGAFADFELEMLRRGYFVAFLQNKSRWCLSEDIEVKPRFCDFLRNEFGLYKKCFPVGMSCGGMHAVYFAAKYPEYVASMYIDAPVLNLLSCPCGVGIAEDSMYEEFVRDTGLTKSLLLNYRNHPIDHAAALIDNKIPVFLVCGDSDDTVPYAENGKILYDMYKAGGGEIVQIIKSGCGHHPHGLDDPSVLIDFVEKTY